ncbi:MAG: LytR/AlgR family response regulator transcription factor [Massilimicrobiota timonensis]
MDIVLIDDDSNFLGYFKTKIIRNARLIFDDIRVDTSTNFSILNKKRYSIYFLDIDLINENGIKVAKSIKSINRHALIIFVTSKNNLVYDALSIQPFYFIRKSELDNDLATAFILLKDFFIQKKYYSFKYDNQDIRLCIDNIRYCETNDHLTTIYTQSKQFHIYKSLKLILSEIDDDHIVQVNKKQCVNIINVVNNDKNKIMMDDGTLIKIGNKYKNEFYHRLDKYINSNDFI